MLSVSQPSRLAVAQAQAKPGHGLGPIQPGQWRNGWGCETQEVLHLWVLTLLGLAGAPVGLRLQRVDFLREREMSHLIVDQTSDTWGQSFVFARINLTPTPHIFLCISPQNAFLAILWKNPSSTDNTPMHRY